MSVLHTTLKECLRLMLQPVVRFCLKRSLGVQDVLEELKYVFLKMGAEQMEALGEEVNVSRLSAMTGIHRRDVRRIYRREETKDAQSISSRVIGRWQTDRQFATRPGRARVLKVNDRVNEFETLVSKVGSDLHSSTVLFELERIGAVRRVRDGVKLLQRVYTPRGNMQEGLRFLALDTRDLMDAVMENVTNEEKEPNHHATTVFDAIVPEVIPAVKEWFLREGSAFHQKARNFLSQFDRESNPSVKGGSERVRVVLGSFSLVQPPVEGATKEKK